MKQATISIGLPVYNGERYLAEAIDSILSQDYGDFELLICDNASTDGTADICSRYEKADNRVRVLRQSENIGAARNFNVAFHATEGPYFKWCACDDLLSPDYLRKILALLQAHPEASLAHCNTRIFRNGGEELEIFEPDLDMPADDPVRRLEQVLFHGQRCYEVFGIMRRETLASTGLIGNYRGGDNVLLYRLAMLGPFVNLPEPLFHLRRHEEQSTVMVADTHAYHAWFTGKRDKISFPDWRYLGETWAVPKGIDMTMAQRVQCLSALLRASYRRRRRLVQNLRVAGETLVFGSSDPARRRRLGRKNRI